MLDGRGEVGKVCEEAVVDCWDYGEERDFLGFFGGVAICEGPV